MKNMQINNYYNIYKLKNQLGNKLQSTVVKDMDTDVNDKTAKEVDMIC